MDRLGRTSYGLLRKTGEMRMRLLLLHLQTDDAIIGKTFQLLINGGNQDETN